MYKPDICSHVICAAGSVHYVSNTCNLLLLSHHFLKAFCKRAVNLIRLRFCFMCVFYLFLDYFLFLSN